MGSLHCPGGGVHLLRNSAIHGAEDLEGLRPAEAGASDDPVPVDLRRYALQNPLHSRPGHIPCLPFQPVRLPGSQVRALGRQEGRVEREDEANEVLYCIISRFEHRDVIVGHDQRIENGVKNKLLLSQQRAAKLPEDVRLTFLL